MKSISVVKTKHFIYLTLFLLIGTITYGQKSCLYKNPLCFYNTDILTYLQVLHKNQQYEKMIPFMHGPMVDARNNKTIIQQLSSEDFGYAMKRVGIKEVTKNKWSITYQRTLLGTNENFKVECSLIKGTCRIYLDKNQWERIFK